MWEKIYYIDMNRLLRNSIEGLSTFSRELFLINSNLDIGPGLA